MIQMSKIKVKMAEKKRFKIIGKREISRSKTKILLLVKIPHPKHPPSF